MCNVKINIEIADDSGKPDTSFYVKNMKLKMPKVELTKTDDSYMLSQVIISHLQKIFEKYSFIELFGKSDEYELWTN